MMQLATKYAQSFNDGYMANGYFYSKYTAPEIESMLDKASKQPLDCKPRICGCCGAPLHGSVCEYCDIEYGSNEG